MSCETPAEYDISILPEVRGVWDQRDMSDSRHREFLTKSESHEIACKTPCFTYCVTAQQPGSGAHISDGLTDEQIIIQPLWKKRPMVFIKHRTCVLSTAVTYFLLLSSISPPFIASPSTITTRSGWCLYNTSTTMSQMWAGTTRSPGWGVWLHHCASCLRSWSFCKGHGDQMRESCPRSWVF